jgi:hypothetical protein
LSAAALAVLAACGSGSAGRDVPFTPDDVLQDASGQDSGPEEVRPPTQVDEAFRVVFPYVDYVPSPTTPTQVYWMNPAQREADPRTTFDAVLPVQEPALTCRGGCIAAPSGKWLAVVVSESVSATEGNVVRLFRLYDGPTLVPSGIPDVVNVRSFAFAMDPFAVGMDSFVFTRMQLGCYEADVHQKACAKFFRIDLSGPNPAGEESLFTFPTEAALDATLPPSGNFRMGQDGKTVIVLGPTVASQSVWLWRGPTGLPVQVTGPICAGIGPDDTCISAGLGFRDTDPVALSPDGNHLVLALVEDNRSLVLTHVDLRNDPRTRKTASLLALQGETKDYGLNRCYNRQAWQPTFVLAPLRFTPDGTEIVFVAGTDCEPNKNRSWTNVLALPLARIDAEGAIARDDLRWITDFPQGDTLAACVSILPGAMDLSPTGDYVVFAGSPTLNSSFEVIPDSNPQLTSDAEVWVTRRDGTTEPVQLTAKSGWRVTSTLAIPVPPPAP